MNKKNILDNIYYNLGRQHTDFGIFGLHKDFSTKWKKYSKVCFPLNPWETSNSLNKVNNRTICKNEIVLDIENKNDLKKLIKKISQITDCDIYLYDTGSRGIHIHLWYKNPIEQDIQKRLIKIFKADNMKLTGKPIALEDTPHWKTGRTKKLIWKQKNL